MKKYEVTLHRVVEHETIFRVTAEDEAEAESLVLSGMYEEVIGDNEVGEVEDPDVIDILEL